MYWLISTEHLHKVAPTMNSQSRDSTKLLEKAGRIQHLVQIGFDTQISRTEQKRTRLGCTLSTKKASTKAIFPKSGQIASWELSAEWIPHPYNAKHHWEAHGTHCCQETHQRPREQGGTPRKSKGFRPGKCTLENAAAFAYDVYKGFQRKEQTAAVAINLEDAYNRVQFKLLMDLLMQYGASLTPVSYTHLTLPTSVYV